MKLGAPGAYDEFSLALTLCGVTRVLLSLFN